jgi:murein DD-endopeptidase MepM/ murein hydrolase activator NlpD
VPTPFDHFYFARPIAANEVNWPLADYRYGGVFLPDVVHTGIDIPAPLETPVIAAGSGRVTWAGYGLYRGVEDTTDPYGLAVAIKHNFGYNGETLYTVYGHLERVDVLVGQQVNTGDMLGLVGQTGKVTGPHLHFEVRLGRNNFFQSRNPELWLAPPQGWGILAGRLMNSNGALLSSLLISVHSKSTLQFWAVKSYGRGAAIGDDYYQENLVLGDLPEGDYTIWIPFEGGTYNLDVHISPGRVTYFRFHGKDGVESGLPPTPRPAFTPPAPQFTSTP